MRMGARLRATPPWFVWLLTAVMLCHTSINLVRPMVSYRALELGVAPQYLGMVAACYAIVPVLVALPVGRVADRRGGLVFAVVGSALLTIASAGLGASDTVGALLSLFVFLGVGHLLAMIALQGLVARHSAPEEFDRRFGYFTFASALGQLLGPAIAGGVTGGFGQASITAALAAGAVVAGLALPCALLIRAPGPVATPRPDNAEEPPPSLVQILRAPGVARAMLASLLVLSAVDILIIYMPALGDERGLATSTVAWLLTLRAAASMVSRLFLGLLVDRFGRSTLLGAGMLISAVAWAQLAIATQVWTIALAMVILGATLGLAQPLSMAWVATQSPANAVSTALSMRLMGNRCGQVTVPALVGAVSSAGGVTAVCIVTGVTLASSVLVVRSR